MPLVNFDRALLTPRSTLGFLRKGQTLLVLIALIAGWAIVVDVQFGSDVLRAFRSGTWITVQVSGLAVAWGTVVAVVFGVASLSRIRPLRWFIRVYVEVLRGVSAIILLFWMAFALPRMLDINLEPLQAGVLALGLNLSAYGAEIVRGAVQAVPKGQTEAAIAINLSNLRRIWSITLPQAAVTILPPYGSLLIEVMKASALVALIGLNDIFFFARDLRNQADAPSSEAVFSATLVLYFIISYAITGVVRWLEQRFGRGLEIGRMARTVK